MPDSSVSLCPVTPGWYNDITAPQVSAGQRDDGQVMRPISARNLAPTVGFYPDPGRGHCSWWRMEAAPQDSAAPSVSEDNHNPGPASYPFIRILTAYTTALTKTDIGIAYHHHSLDCPILGLITWQTWSLTPAIITAPPYLSCIMLPNHPTLN